MSGLEERLRAVDELFTRGSKGHQCAVEVVRKGGRIPMSERPLIYEKIGCSVKTFEAALTKLKKAGLYGSTDEPLTTEKPIKTQEVESITEESRPTPKEEPEPKVEVEEFEEPEEKYVTVDKFNRLLEEIRVLSGITPIQEPETGEDYVEEPFEAPTPESVDLEAASMKQMGTWIEAKNLIYFDFARNGAFGGALEDFDGNWSDFVNTVLDDYFRSSCTKGGPCQYRMNVGLGLLSKRFA